MENYNNTAVDNYGPVAYDDCVTKSPCGVTRKCEVCHEKYESRFNGMDGLRDLFKKAWPCPNGHQQPSALKKLLLAENSI